MLTPYQSVTHKLQMLYINWLGCLSQLNGCGCYSSTKSQLLYLLVHECVVYARSQRANTDRERHICQTEHTSGRRTTVQTRYIQYSQLTSTTSVHVYVETHQQHCRVHGG